MQSILTKYKIAVIDNGRDFAFKDLVVPEKDGLYVFEVRNKKMTLCDNIVVGIESRSAIADNDPEIFIRNTLHRLGVPHGLSGRKYLLAAFMKIASDSNYLTGLTKLLYPDVAKEYDTEFKYVERGIRYVINRIADVKGGWFIYKVLGMIQPDGKKKPSPREFLSALYDCYMRGEGFRD